MDYCFLDDDNLDLEISFILPFAHNSYIFHYKPLVAISYINQQYLIQTDSSVQIKEKRKK